MPHVLVPVTPAALGAPRVRLAADGRLEQPAEHRLDPIDALSLEWAVAALERGEISGVTAVSIGAAPAIEALRAARSRGCPELLRIDPAPLTWPDVATVARVIAAAARRADAVVVALGSESHDGSGGVVPGAVAAALGWPLLSRARELTVRDGDLAASCATAAGARSASAALPAVVSFADGAIQPRTPRLAAALAARRAAVPSVSAAELLDEVAAAEWTGGVVAVETVPPRARQRRVVSGEEGVRELLAVVGAAADGAPR